MACLASLRETGRRLVAALGLFALLGGAAPDEGAVLATAKATIQTVTGQVRAALDANAEALRKRPSELADLVAKITDPYLDFTLMSEEALGPAWRRADAQQRTRFTQAFHQLLTEDYMAVLKQYSGQTVRVTAMRWEDAEHRRALVESQIESPGEKPVQVDYRMYSKGGRWKVYDVLVEGTSLLINYRETFADELQHESLDTLVAQLVKKVAENRARESQ